MYNVHHNFCPFHSWEYRPYSIFGYCITNCHLKKASLHMRIFIEKSRIYKVLMTFFDAYVSGGHAAFEFLTANSPSTFIVLFLCDTKCFNEILVLRESNTSLPCICHRSKNKSLNFEKMKLQSLIFL